jgi:predicted metalloprotease
LAEAPELQADCLARLALYGAARDQTITFDDGYGNEIAKTYYLLGDDIPWADPSEHGDGVDRVAAFAAGRSGDISDCIP